MITHPARTAYLLLRIGAALAFLYPPLSALFGDPYTWLGYFPAFTRGYLPDLALLHAGAVEIVIGLWLLPICGLLIRAPGYRHMSALWRLTSRSSMLSGVTIACRFAALALIHWPKEKGVSW